MVQEKELLEKKIEWLTEELKKKTEELLNTCRVKGEEILELNSSLKISTEQVTSYSTAHCFAANKLKNVMQSLTKPLM